MDISILAISTALPPFAIDQESIADFFIDAFLIESEKAKELRHIHKNSTIRTRYSAIPDFGEDRNNWSFLSKELPNNPPSMHQRNDFYKIEAIKIAFEAAKKAINSWGGDPKTITHVISVSCTGVVAPGIEFNLIKLLDLNPTVQRLGINFMGCFGAFKGLLVAKAFAKENPKNRVLVVCTELCSLHFQVEQTSDNILGNSLFSDGAAAVIVGALPSSNETPLWHIEKTCSIGIEDSLDKITWEAGNSGFLMKLSHKIPVLLGRHIQTFSKALLGDDLTNEEVDWAIHPGGKSILQVIEKKLNLKKEQTKSSWEVLENFGNMSSATFLFVLNQLVENKRKAKWTAGVGFGPGLSIEGILLKQS